MYAASAAKYVGVPSERTTTRSRSSPYALVLRPDGAVRLVGLDRLEGGRDLGLDEALPLEGVEVDPEPFEGGLDLLEHPRHGVARLAGEVGHVVAAVSVLGRILAAPQSLHGRPEEVHLGSSVVVVVLALDVVAGELEQARDRVAVRPVARRRDGDRAGRIRRDELDLDPLDRIGKAGTESPARTEYGGEGGAEPGVVDGEVQKSRARDLDGRDPVELRDLLAQLLRDLARRPPPLPRKPERDVRRVVAVASVGRALELDRHAGEAGESRRERAGRIGALHHRIVRSAMAQQPGSGAGTDEDAGVTAHRRPPAITARLCGWATRPPRRRRARASSWRCGR